MFTTAKVVSAPFCEHDADRNRKIVDLTVKDGEAYQKALAHIESLTKTSRQTSFVNDIRIAAYKAKSSLLCYPADEFTEKVYMLDNTETTIVPETKKMEFNFFFSKSSKVMNQTTIGFPLMHTSASAKKFHAFFPRALCLSLTPTNLTLECLFQKVLILLELETSGVFVHQMECDFFPNNCKFDLTIQYRGIFFKVPNISKLVIFSHRNAVFYGRQEQSFYLGLLSRDELSALNVSATDTLLSLLLTRFPKFINHLFMDFKPTNFFDTVPHHGKIVPGYCYTDKTSVGYASLVSETSCDLVCLFDQTGKRLTVPLVKTITNLSTLQQLNYQHVLYADIYVKIL